MIPLLAAAVDLLTFCSARDWRICVIGGLAVQRWGEPRVTRDVDVSLLTDFGREEAFIERDTPGVTLTGGRDWPPESDLLEFPRGKGEGVEAAAEGFDR